MRKIFIAFLFIFISLFLSPQTVYADSLCEDVKIWAIDKDGTRVYAPDSFVDETFDAIYYSITIKDKDPTQQYIVTGDTGDPRGIKFNFNYNSKDDTGKAFTGPKLEGSISLKRNSNEFSPLYKNHRLNVYRNLETPPKEDWSPLCTAQTGDNDKLKYSIEPSESTPIDTCKLWGRSYNNDQMQVTTIDRFYIFGQLIGLDISNLSGVEFAIINRQTDVYKPVTSRLLPSRGTDNQDFEALVNKLDQGVYSVQAILRGKEIGSGTDYGPPENIILGSCSFDFTVCDKGGCGFPTPTPVDTDSRCFNIKNAKECKKDPNLANCNICKSAARKRLGIDIPNLKPLCDQLNTDFRGKCWQCQDKGEIWSAIGCLPTDFSELIKKYVFTTGVGIAGGIAFMYFLYGAFMVLTSSGNAEKMEEAKQIITSALAGLLLIIFSIFLLSIIGVQILQLPGFS